MLWKAEEVKRGLLDLLQPKSFHDSMTETKKDKNRHRERQFAWNIIKYLGKVIFLHFISYGTFYSMFISQYGARSLS